MSDLNLQKIHDLLIEVAHEAGRMMLSARPSNESSGTKKNTADLVTETDRAVEAMVSTRLTSAYPTFSFIGEETYTPGLTLTAAPTFIVDPIDGTTNFVHNFPAFCISLGLVVAHVPVVGIVYNPCLDELYTAIKGSGAFLTRNSLTQKNSADKLKLPHREPEKLENLSTCLVGAEWGSDRSGSNFALKSQVFTRLAAAKADGGAMVHSIRCLGSAALNLCMVASGQQDVFWEGGCWAWDVAAGWCILLEAGGMIVGGNPGQWEVAVDGRVYLAIRGGEEEGQKKIVEEFWGVVGEGKLIYVD
ncbi:myo-inositol-1-monophosphatase [Calycina marina]|uniref:Inositol-1-monophosphatase n=1 Tax=Calycina marina TaxID=1763456 RepID=A0A9P7YW18_9HELO|nr:myo-inositol-1-monophosphatase [Calycina marina]